MIIQDYELRRFNLPEIPWWDVKQNIVFCPLVFVISFNHPEYFKVKEYREIGEFFFNYKVVNF